MMLFSKATKIQRRRYCDGWEFDSTLYPETQQRFYRWIAQWVHSRPSQGFTYFSQAVVTITDTINRERGMAPVGLAAEGLAASAQGTATEVSEREQQAEVSATRAHGAKIMERSAVGTRSKSTSRGIGCKCSKKGNSQHICSLVQVEVEVEVEDTVEAMEAAAVAEVEVTTRKFLKFSIHLLILSVMRQILTHQA
jgi:hypothetical protein